MPSLVERIKQLREKELNSFVPAKNVEVLSKEDQQSIDEFKIEFNKSYIDEAESNARRVESDGFHPSSLGTDFGKCSRYQIYMLRGAEKQNVFSAQTLRILGAGTDIHEKLQERLDKMGVLVAAEVPISYDYPPIKGHGDGVLDWRGRKILLEIKSIGLKGFEYRQMYKAPKDKHFAQANIYAYILELEYQWYLYYCKNNDDFEIFQRKTDHAAAEKIIKKWTRDYETFLDGELPSRKYKKDGPTCQYCPLKDYCWSDLTPSV